MLALDEKSGDHQRLYKFHSKPFKSSRHFTQNHKCQHHGGAGGKVSKSPNSLCILREPCMSVQNLMTIHEIIVEIFNSGPSYIHSSIEPSSWCGYKCGSLSQITEV